MILILVLGSFALQRPALAFGYGNVVQRAKALAATAYTKPEKTLPRSLQRLAYQEYRQIRMKPEKVLWAGEGTAFEVSFFHPGRRFDQPVKVNVITAQGVREIPFDPRQFDYGNNRIDPAELEGLGHAGFRVLYPVNDPERKDELLSFLGASYFRAVAPGQVYGLSARGLAIDTGLPSGEEFPRFVEFWIARPARADRALILYALLDSPRATPSASASCSATARSRATRTRTRPISTAPAPGSPPRASGARAASNWSRFRPPTRPTTTSWRIGCPTSPRHPVSRMSSSTA